MTTDSVSVPITIAGLYQGLAEANGLAIADASTLRLEFVLGESILGVVKSQMTTVDIPLTDLIDVVLHKGLFSTKLVLHARTMENMNQVPGSEKGEATLHIARKDRDRAEQFCAFLSARVTP